MGLHICFMDNFHDHPDWDFLRGGNDKDFATLVCNTIDISLGERNDTGCFRPTADQLLALHKAIDKTDWDNKQRYVDLLNLIPENPSYFLSFSY